MVLYDISQRYHLSARQLCILEIEQPQRRSTIFQHFYNLPNRATSKPVVGKVKLDYALGGNAV